MKNLRKYGKTPFTIAVIHGGPGASGEMAPVARELSLIQGTLEPFQSSTSIQGQIQELHTALKKYGDLPMILIGHSWGAWLIFLYAAQYPSAVKKIILVSSGPFKEKYAKHIMEIRLNRLNREEKKQVSTLFDRLEYSQEINKNKVFAQIGQYLFKTDSCHPLQKIEAVDCNYEIFQSIWKEAEQVRRSGTLLESGKQIRCPVVAIHGDYDPHPFEGVQQPLSSVISDFRFILLKDCGHYPWIERDAKKRFYEILHEELI